MIREIQTDKHKIRPSVQSASRTTFLQSTLLLLPETLLIHYLVQSVISIKLSVIIHPYWIFITFSLLRKGRDADAFKVNFGDVGEECWCL